MTAFPSAATGVAAALRQVRAPTLRWYQRDLKQAVNDAWGAHPNVLAVMPTGAGKTVLFSSIIGDHQGSSCCIAHRSELIEQISMALARNGIRHRIIGPDKLIRAICKMHLEELGICFYDANGRAGVASVQSLTARQLKLHAKWIEQVTLWVQDEAHHVLRENQWGKAAELFPRAKGLGVTATPVRADGKGLGRHASGVFDVMVCGPTMRDLIDWGFLTDYRVIVSETHIDLAGVGLGSDGDYVLDRGKGKAAVRKSTLVGDVVGTYSQHAAGRQAIVFASDTETSGDMAAQFRAAGVTAEHVDGMTDPDARRAIMRRFRNRETHVLCNVGLVSEGFDVPGVEVVILAAKTISFSKHAQQVGRALRLLIDRDLMAQWDDIAVPQRLQHIAASGKPKALVIDHVGSFLDVRLGLPDAKNDWTLDDAERKASSGPNDVIPNRACLNPVCLSPFSRALPCCPYCGWKPEPGAGRSGPEAVDGDMLELEPALLAAMRAEVAKIAMPEAVFREQAHIRKLPTAWAQSNVKKHYEHRLALAQLQEAMAWWAGEQRAHGRGDSEVFRRFYLTFGTDWLTCQAQDRQSMEKLTGWIMERLTPASLAGMLGTEVG